MEKTMKKHNQALLATIVVFGLLAIPFRQVSAQSGVPALCSGYQFQNLDSTTASTTVLQAYAMGSGTLSGSKTYNIGLSSSTSDYLGGSGGSFLSPGSYSAVASSNTQLNALVNQVDCGTVGLNVGASYSGLSSTQVANTVYLAFVMSRAFGAQNWNSVISIQNAGSATATSVQIQFFRSGQSTPAETFSTTNLAAGAAWYLDLSQGTYATANLAGFSGAAVVTSTGAPVAVVTMYAPSDGSRLLAYNGVTAGGQTLYATQVSRNYAAGVYQGGLSLFNLGSTSTPIAIDFYPAGASTPIYTKTDSVGGSSAYILYMGPGGPLDSVPAMNGFNGSAVVRVTSGSNNLVGIFNLNSAAGAAGAANMVSVTQATTTLRFPQIVRSFGTGPYESGWQVVNTSGSTTANLTIRYVKSDGTVSQSNQSLAPNTALSVYVGGTAGAALGTGWNGSLTITSNTPIVGQANFVNVGAGAKDSLLIYNGFNN
jgi:hypothetical protein